MAGQPKPPAGWYPNPQNRAERRYWDGSNWTNQTAPNSSGPSAQPRQVGAATWVGIAVTALLLIIAMSTGFGPFLVMVGIIAAATATYTLISLRRGWAHLPKSRPIAGGILGGAIVLALIGGGISSAAEAGPPSNNAAHSTPRSATPTPTPTVASDEPLDPATPIESSTGPVVSIPNRGSTTGSALSIRDTLPIHAAESGDTYARTTDFGTAWIDVDHNDCDTRNDILSRDLTDVVKSGTCKVLSGNLADNYTGAELSFTRGETTSALIQIDHVVPLLDAWLTGAQELSLSQRISLANDPIKFDRSRRAIERTKVRRRRSIVAASQ